MWCWRKVSRLSLWLWLALLLALPASAKDTVIVCAEDLAYYPHYDFTPANQGSYANDVLALFAKSAGLTLHIKALPIKRLKENNDCDLQYPDNPRWHQHEKALGQRFYSKALVAILGATLVKPAQQQLTLDKVRAISVIRGFVPDHLLAVQGAYSFKLVETVNAEAALQMVLKGRVDAVDMEWNVARHLLTKMAQPQALVIAQQLPHSEVAFHLSSQTKPELIQQFDLFLQQQQQQIQALKQKYRLVESWQQAVATQP